MRARKMQRELVGVSHRPGPIKAFEVIAYCAVQHTRARLSEIGVDHLL
jgi:hypothetical protein